MGFEIELFQFQGQEERKGWKLYIHSILSQQKHFQKQSRTFPYSSSARSSGLLSPLYVPQKRAIQNISELFYSYPPPCLYFLSLPPKFSRFKNKKTYQSIKGCKWNAHRKWKKSVNFIKLHMGSILKILKHSVLLSSMLRGLREHLLRERTQTKAVLPKRGEAQRGLWFAYNHISLCNERRVAQAQAFCGCPKNWGGYGRLTITIDLESLCK